MIGASGMVRKVEAVLHSEVVVRYKTIDNTERSCCSMIARLEFEGGMKDFRGRELSYWGHQSRPLVKAQRSFDCRGWEGKRWD